MTKRSLKGVIAAAATPITKTMEPDLPRYVTLCKWLLDNGCDGLNLTGTTGEATSFGLAQRLSIMSAAAATLPMTRLMVGTGASSVGDAVILTRHAAALGFAGALLLPPFYYKGVDDDGVVRYIERIVEATKTEAIDIYLYNFPALSGVPYSAPLVSRLLREFGERIAGLKDSSGDLDYARGIVALSPQLAVFPSNEAILLRARAGEFAGCISASANINSAWCGKAFNAGDEKALDVAVKLRGLVSRKALVSSIKAVLADRLGDAAFEALLPPLSALAPADKAELLADVRKVIGEAA